MDKWIPVSERLPEEPNPYINVFPEDVLVWERHYSYKAEDYVEEYNIGWCLNGNWSIYGIEKAEVLAWMPLPERYNESEENK